MPRQRTPPQIEQVDLYGTRDYLLRNEPIIKRSSNRSGKNKWNNRMALNTQRKERYTKFPRGSRIPPSLHSQLRKNRQTTHGPNQKRRPFHLGVRTKRGTRK